ncbi:enoyl-CoA hydratase/isomerase family protein [bacterium]|nr:MAG: enoyl-CoA hydratase/isomerase family protein [bacterium]
MEYSRISYKVEGRKAVITLKRPEKRNAMDDVMVNELTLIFGAAGRDPEVKALLLQAAGPAFCSGADLEYLSRIAKFDLEENRMDSFRLANLFRTIYELRKPVVALVNGPALAGGCGLASVCDFVIASEERAQFGYTEAHIGFVPAIVLFFLIKRVGEGRARELVLRGNILSAVEAKEIGLVSLVVPEKELQPAGTRLLEELLTENSLTSMTLCKELLSKLHGMNLADALDFAANMNAAARMTPECKQGIAAFLNKQPLKW